MVRVTAALIALDEEAHIRACLESLGPVADEIIVVLHGTLRARLGDDVVDVTANQTMVIPPNVPHGFTNEGTEDAKILTFFPVQRPFDGTTFLEGEPPGQG